MSDSEITTALESFKTPSPRMCLAASAGVILLLVATVFAVLAFLAQHVQTMSVDATDQLASARIRLRAWRDAD